MNNITSFSNRSYKILDNDKQNIYVKLKKFALKKILPSDIFFKVHK